MTRKITISSFFLMLLMVVYSQSLIDSSNPIVRQGSQILMEHGLKVMLQDPLEALELLRKSLELFPTSQCAHMLEFLKEFLNMTPDPIHMDVLPIFQLMNDGIAAHYDRDYQKAQAIYDKVLSLEKCYFNAIFHKGISFQHSGFIQEAADMYFRTTQLCPIHTKAILNLATLHQKFGDFRDSIPYYKQGIQIIESIDAKVPQLQIWTKREDYFMLYANLALAYMQSDELEEVTYRVD
jgi:tetratricopeptide (TPR) repeat protein